MEIKAKISIVQPDLSANKPEEHVSKSQKKFEQKCLRKLNHLQILYFVSKKTNTGLVHSIQSKMMAIGSTVLNRTTQQNLANLDLIKHGWFDFQIKSL